MGGLDADNDSYMHDMISAGLNAAKRMKKDPESTGALAGVHEGGEQQDFDKDEVDSGTNNLENVSVEHEDDDGEVKPTECDCSWVVVLAGSMKVTKDADIEGYTPFATLAVEKCALGAGKWYYEAEIMTAGLMQIGWANSNFRLSSDSSDGVGDDTNSYSYDGSRQMKWNGESEIYGLEWNVGDIIGCLIDVSTSYVDITYYL